MTLHISEHSNIVAELWEEIRCLKQRLDLQEQAQKNTTTLHDIQIIPKCQPEAQSLQALSSIDSQNVAASVVNTADLDDGKEEMAYGLKQERNHRALTTDSEEEDIRASSESEGVKSNVESESNKGDSDNNSQEISVALSKRKPDNRRKYDKLVACFFCEKLFKGKIRRHLEGRHRDEAEVTRVMMLTSEEERSKGFSALGKRGNFKHNSKVFSANKGSLIVSRRPSKQSHSAEDYLPCKRCYALFLKGDLWRHTARCQVKTSENDSSSEDTKKPRISVTAASRMVLEGAMKSDQVTVSKDFQEDVIARMRYDTVTRRARNDSLVMRFGSALYHKYGRQRVHDISQQLRILARLLSAVRKERGAEKQTTLESLLSGRNFDRVVEATEKLSKRHIDKDTGRPLCVKPSVGLKLGHILVKCAEMKRGMGIRTGDSVMEKEADAFLSLHSGEWTNKISSASLTSLKHRRYNNPDILPLTEDLIKLRKYQETSLVTFTDILKKDSTAYNWRRLRDIVYTRVVIFNKRRGGETARLPLSAFLNRPKWKNVANDVLIESLKPLERKLLKRMDMVHLPGKGVGGRRVPLILTPNIVSAMELLAEKRNCCDIPKSNVYFFATPLTDGFINGWQAMHDVAVAAQVKDPKLIHSTRLRKYIATVSQIVSLTPGEMKWLANHLGHDVKILENVYRLQDSTIELAKISRLMMAVDTGHMAEFAGKALNEIHISDIPPNVDDTDDDVDDSCEPSDIASEGALVPCDDDDDDDNSSLSSLAEEIAPQQSKSMKADVGRTAALTEKDYPATQVTRRKESAPTQPKHRKADVSKTAALSFPTEKAAPTQVKRRKESAPVQPKHRKAGAACYDYDSSLSSLAEETAPPQLKNRKPAVSSAAAFFSPFVKADQKQVKRKKTGVSSTVSKTEDSAPTQPKGVSSTASKTEDSAPTQPTGTKAAAPCDDYDGPLSSLAEETAPPKLKLRKPGVSSTATLPFKTEESASTQLKRRKAAAPADDENSSLSSLTEETVPPKLKLRKPGIRIKWTPEEISILRKELAAFFKSVTVPSTAEINRIREKYSELLNRRSVPQIKSRAWALIQKKSK